MYSSSCLIIYPFPTSLSTLGWWFYTCILPLIVNKVEWFKFSVGWKESPSILFSHMLCEDNSMRHKRHAKKLFACYTLQRKGYGKTSLTSRMLLFLQRSKDSPQKIFRQKRSWLRNYTIYLFIVSLIITLTFHCILYFIESYW